MRVVHLTSVHSPADPRIAGKECASLADAGYEVVLVAPADGTAPPGNVRLHALRPATSRVERMTVTAASAATSALRLRGDVFHVHDPELLPWGLLLRLTGRPVVYDVHEDYVTSLRQKVYLAPWLRTLLARCWDAAERTLARPLTVVLAERYYRERFPAGVLVLNYPVPDRVVSAHAPASHRLLYTGNVTEDRGALLHAGLLARAADVELTMVGRCSADVAARVRAVASGHEDRLSLVGVDRYVPFSEIRETYRRGGWLCGLAVFPRTPHYVRKELTKFFEYMQAGLPILCSDFPAWRALVEDQGAGLCVPPEDPEALAAAVGRLRADPANARAMGERGRQLAQERYTWASQARTLVDLYRRLLSP